MLSTRIGKSSMPLHIYLEEIRASPEETQGGGTSKAPMNFYEGNYFDSEDACRDACLRVSDCAFYQIRKRIPLNFTGAPPCTWDTKLSSVLDVTESARACC